MTRPRLFARNHPIGFASQDSRPLPVRDLTGCLFVSQNIPVRIRSLLGCSFAEISAVESTLDKGKTFFHLFCCLLLIFTTICGIIGVSKNNLALYCDVFNRQGPIDREETVWINLSAAAAFMPRST